MTKPDWCPADVWASAWDVEVEADFSFDGQSSGFKERQWTAENIARAILAERERALEEAAAVAANYRPWQRRPETNYGWATARSEIARDIRALKETP